MITLFIISTVLFLIASVVGLVLLLADARDTVGPSITAEFAEIVKRAEAHD